jgi:uncharacterized membrane protein
LNVFLPTAPNPTSGFMLVVPRATAAILPLTIEEGVRLIISGGSVMDANQAAELRQSVRQLTTASEPAPLRGEEPS